MLPYSLQYIRVLATAVWQFPGGSTFMDVPIPAAEEEPWGHSTPLPPVLFPAANTGGRFVKDS